MSAPDPAVQAQANPVRPFPANRIARIVPANHRIAVIYRGQVQTFDDPEALRQHFFPTSRLARGDQVVVIHDGLAHTYANPQALHATILKAMGLASQKTQARRLYLAWNVVAFGVGLLACAALMGVSA